MSPRNTACVAVGTSWGGLDALRFLIGSLTPDFPAPIVVVQHRGSEDDDALLKVLQSDSVVEVKEAMDKDELEPGKLYLAPAGYHLLVEGETLALSTEAPIAWARPSIDALFESVADAYGRRAIGVILTGAGKDGPHGAVAIKKRGGTVVVQTPSTAENRILPDAVISVVKPDRILTLAEMVPYLSLRVRELRGASGEA